MGLALVVFVVLLDLSHYANTYAQRGTIEAGMGGDTGTPPSSHV